MKALIDETALRFFLSQRFPWCFSREGFLVIIARPFFRLPLSLFSEARKE
jgi:hypothetical protein